VTMDALSRWSLFGLLPAAVLLAVAIYAIL
jgi:hypothetical protein